MFLCKSAQSVCSMQYVAIMMYDVCMSNETVSYLYQKDKRTARFYTHTHATMKCPLQNAGNARGGAEGKYSTKNKFKNFIWHFLVY